MNNLIKLSELKNDVIVMDENLNTYTVEEVKNDLQHFKDENKKLYTTTEYHAHIEARGMLEDAIECEYCNEMYEDWDERILDDITDDDVEKIQDILDEILSRNKEQNTSYFQDKEIEIDKYKEDK